VIDSRVPYFLVLAFSLYACDRDAPRDMPAAVPPPVAPQAKPRVTEASIIARFRLSFDGLREELLEKGEIYRERSPDGTSSPSSLAPVMITSRVRTRLLHAVAPSPLRILVTTREGHVTLTGEVESVERLQKALVAVLSAPYVRALTSRVQVSTD